MTNTDAGAMASLVRRARGRGQNEVAAAANISQGTLSKFENGLIELEEERLAAVARALDIPVTRLARAAPTDSALSACAFHRKRSSLPVSEINRIRALLDLTRLQIEDVLGDAAPPLQLRRTPIDLDEDFGPIDAARAVRSAIAPNPGPVRDLAEAAENHGVLLVRRDLGTDKIDAIGTWPDGHRPLFMLHADAPADRQRFTLAHELGHAVMHDAPSDTQEDEADQFAAELLMPARQIRDQLRHLTLARLAALKDQWRVSMAALVRRARDLDAINEYEYRKLNIELSAAGYRTREPVAITPDCPTMLARTITQQLAQETTEAYSIRHGMSPSDLSALTGGTP